MESIALEIGLYTAPNEKEWDFFEFKKLALTLPRRALTDTDLVRFSEQLKIPNFRGVFTRNNLPKKTARSKECGIINQDDKENPGTHGLLIK